MNKHARKPSLSRIPDGFIPVAFLASSFLGRGGMALQLFIGLFTVRLCALSTASGLRSTFSMQPSLRFVQGSALMALGLQFLGALIALPVLKYSVALPNHTWLVLYGLLLNIEHVFYEYFHAIGDNDSVYLYRGISALLLMTGILLGAPPHKSPELSSYGRLCILTALLIPLIVGIAVISGLGEKPRPKFSIDLLKHTPASMLRTLLYPALVYLSAISLQPDISLSIPLFSGLVVIELCQAPFRRSPSECIVMNRILLILSIAAASLLPISFSGLVPFKDPSIAKALIFSLGAFPLASLCAFGLYGNFSVRGRFQR